VAPVGVLDGAFEGAIEGIIEPLGRWLRCRTRCVAGNA
jgi:hypothetical protein